MTKRVEKEIGVLVIAQRSKVGGHGERQDSFRCAHATRMPHPADALREDKVRDDRTHKQQQVPRIPITVK